MRYFFLTLFCLPLLTSQLHAEDHATVSLQRWQDKIVVTINHEDGWHTYWKNPGDSGLPTTFKFFSAGKNIEPKAYEWPSPKRYIEAGDILTIGYGGIQHFFFQTEVSDLEVKVGMLICKDICIPNEANLKLGRSEKFVSNRKASAYADSDLTKAFEKLPKDASLPAGFEYYLTRQKDKNILTLHYAYKNLKNLKLPYELNLLTAFPHPPFGFKREKLYQDGEAILGQMEIEWDGEYQDPVVPLPANGQFPTPYELDFILNDPTTGKSSKIKLKIKDFSLVSPTLENFYQKLPPFGLKDKTSSALAGGSENSFLSYFFLAFLGGLILNLMPCVLPVISLKLFGLIRHQNYSQKRLFAHNLTYTAGVIATFLALALVIAGLKASGEEVGWGFQLQSPSFILMMMMILFIFSLNLFGLFEFRTPGGSKLGGVETEDGFVGDFFSGVLTTILSTPCSAPFLGTALTFAFTSSYLNIFIMFIAIGLGLSSPFLLTAIFPKSLHIFPKPGAWMEKLKYFLGLSLIVTVIWLYDVFVSLVNFEKISWRLNLLFALWFFAFFFIKKISRSKIFGFVLFILPLSLTFLASTQLPLKPTSETKFTAGTLWQPWTENKMQELTGQYVFVDFTAEWCLTCKVNKKLVLETKGFEEFAQKNKVVLLRADWTKRDDSITQFLKKYGAVGVPFYVLQKPDGQIVPLGETITTSKLEKNLL